MHLALVLLLVLAAALEPRVRPLLPADDEFYTLPDRLEDAAPGDILKIRATPHSLRNIYFPIDVERSWQLMVRSTDQFGLPSAVVTSVIQPFGGDLDKIVSYQMFIDSTSENCVPSIAMLEGASMMTLSSQLEVLFVQLCLEKGWTVVVPDYGHVESQFPGGPSGGHAVLDSIRGVLQSGHNTGIRSGADVVMWGYSGGSLPTMWGSMLQPQYAPDLTKNLVGVVAGGVVTNLTLVARQNDGSPFAGILAIAMAGFAKTYPQFQAVLKQEMSPKNYQKFISANDRCFFPNMLLYVGTKFFGGDNPMVPSGWDFLDYEICKQIFTENSIGVNASSPMPEAPTLIYHGYMDEILPHADIAAVVQGWCDRGIKSLEFVSDYTSDHLVGVVSGVPLAITWIANRFAGEPPAKGCSIYSKLSFLRYPGATKETWESLVRTGGHYFGMNTGSSTILSVDFFLRFIKNFSRQSPLSLLKKYYAGDAGPLSV